MTKNALLGETRSFKVVRVIYCTFKHTYHGMDKVRMLMHDMGYTLINTGGGNGFSEPACELSKMQSAAANFAT